MLSEIVAHVEGANADDDGVEILEPFLSQIFAFELRDLIAHFLQSLRYLVAGAGQIADPVAEYPKIETDHLDPRREKQELRRNMLIADLDLLIGIARSVHEQRGRNRSG